MPVDLVVKDAEKAEEIVLRCDHAEFARLAPAEQSEFLPGPADDFGYDPDRVMLWPYFGPNAAIIGMSTPRAAVDALDQGPVTRERVPAGTVQIRRGERVEATDGETGRVHGLVIDPESDTITHVLLAEGHLWGRKTVAIPLADVTRVGDTIRVGLSKDELKSLPDAGVGTVE
ncbi:PRC-barrel domain-containing protein [Actinacidiphila alni]|uniref:PRC-barrel domain-containing protein n=1 Tax=Actinacidiphila alni TaxID=380248 RepID=UPI000B828B89|nr:PRC-barrel domain-containing protein [Actinacidiphila alni]